MITFLTTWLAYTPVTMVPLLLACLGLILSERVGIMHLGAEGLMAFGAMTGAIVTLSSGDPWLGLAAGAGAGALLGLPFALATVVFRADHTLAGLAVVALGAGLSATIGRPYVHKPFEGIPPIEIAGLDQLPLVGPMLFNQDPVVYLAVAAAIGLSLVFTRTRLGLVLRAIGDSPGTADAAGVDVQLYQLGAVTLGSALAGLGGAYLSVVSSGVYVDGMVAGRGWIAVALVVFAQWRPARAIAGALVFAAAESLLPRLLAIGADVPTYLLSMLPYAVTIIVLAVLAIARRGRAREPRSLGKPYLRQDRGL